MSRVLVRKEFRAWLYTKALAQVVGTVCDSDYCPLATFLKEKTGHKYRVGFPTYINPRGRETIMPKWARRFIRGVDYKLDTSVTAHQALQCLDRTARPG